MRPVCVALLLGCLSCLARGADLSGRLKLGGIGFDAGDRTVEQALGYKTSHETEGELRGALSESVGPFKVNAALVYQLSNGTSVSRDLYIASLAPELAYLQPNENWWDLSQTFVYGGETRSLGYVDRLNVSWTGRQLVLRMGRQALTWGSGLVFHPMDLVNPFEPLATDTAYKHGTDIGYAQWLFDNGSDVQFAAVERRARGNPAPGAGENTYAMFANIAGDVTQWTLLAARDRRDDVAGIGASHALGSAVWNGEAVISRSGGTTLTSLLTNVTWATVWRAHNVTLFGEYFRNGFGQSHSGYSVAELSDDLILRLSRGQTFVTGRNYLALGMTFGWTPLLQFSPTTIVNLDDGSALMDAQLAWSISDNVALKAGVRLPVGARGTELRGLELAPGADLFLGSPAQGFARVEIYF